MLRTRVEREWNTISVGILIMNTNQRSRKVLVGPVGDLVVLHCKYIPVSTEDEPEEDSCLPAQPFIPGYIKALQGTCHIPVCLAIVLIV